MPLVPGPFNLQPDDAVAVPPGVWDFTADALDMVARVQSNTSGWDDFFLYAELIDVPDDLSQLDTDALLLAVSYGIDWAEFPNIDTAIADYADADLDLAEAFSFAPAAAWQDPPEPYVPPGSVLNLTAPTVPINAYAPGTSGIVGDQSDFSRPTVQLWNFTRIGYVNFFEGDTFELVALGNPGQTLSVGGQFNGATITVTDMGTLDETGKLQLQGTMGPDVIGAWHEDWYLDGALTRSFDFIVSPANA
jgi:hypothetical protein